MKVKRRRLTGLTVWLGITVLLVTGFAAKDLAVEQWYLWQLESDDEDERVVAAERLAEIASGRAVRRLLLVLRAPDDGFLLLPLAALRSPGYDGPPEKGVVPELFQYEIGDHGWNEFRMGKAIASIGAQGLPGVAVAINDEAWQFGGDLSFDALLRKMIDAMGPDTVPYLVAMTRSESPNTRRLAVITLRKHAHDSVRVVEALSTTLRDRDHRIRALSAWSLGELGSAARDAMSDLNVALEDEHEWVRATAREALAKIAGPP